MSVIVKGMKMPESCVTCPLQFGGWCYASPPEIDERVASTVDEAWKKGKPDWCPLVALPEKHGRLIDEDDVINAIHERLHELQTHKEFIKKRGDIDLLGILPYIAKIQAIIESEGYE